MKGIGYRIGRFIRGTQDDVVEGAEYIAKGSVLLAQHSVTETRRFFADVATGYTETPNDRLKQRIDAAQPLRIEGAELPEALA